jgi:hypothetical protein
MAEWRYVGVRSMKTTILAEIERKIIAGTIIPKPQGRADFIVKGWGVRRGDRALIYTIPNHTYRNTGPS